MQISGTYFKFGQSRSALLRKGQRRSLKNLQTTKSMTNCLMYLLLDNFRRIQEQQHLHEQPQDFYTPNLQDWEQYFLEAGINRKTPRYRPNSDEESHSHQSIELTKKHMERTKGRQETRNGSNDEGFAHPVNHTYEMEGSLQRYRTRAPPPGPPPASRPGRGRSTLARRIRSPDRPRSRQTLHPWLPPSRGPWLREERKEEGIAGGQMED
ncbi:hypothetical protein MUK42_08189 [Musa troglodytarum]|uniref:Uncharacterized protein n=1 Tax=Musa troglodytarum TaxID=320322 RepID=A0A9E7J999_9LILI|nr:hypothetical protein MUK42_08189 [Musa troglodytarum]